MSLFLKKSFILFIYMFCFLIVDRGQFQFLKALIDPNGLYSVGRGRRDSRTRPSSLLS